MIKVLFIQDKTEKELTKEFKDLDSYIEWFLKDNDSWGISEVLSGQEIITGEIKQKGINNR